LILSGAKGNASNSDLSVSFILIFSFYVLVRLKNHLHALNFYYYYSINNVIEGK